MNQEESYKYIEDLVGKLEALTEVLGYEYEKMVTYPGWDEALNEFNSKDMVERIKTPLYEVPHKPRFKHVEHRLTKKSTETLQQEGRDALAKWVNSANEEVAIDMLGINNKEFNLKEEMAEALFLSKKKPNMFDAAIDSLKREGKLNENL